MPQFQGCKFTLIYQLLCCNNKKTYFIIRIVKLRYLFKSDKLSDHEKNILIPLVLSVKLEVSIIK